jgi:probable F420-dependent oxidoreductase
VKFGLFFANSGPFAAPETFEVLVTQAEANGFESIWAVEHVVIPIGYESKYPYSPDGRIPMPDETPISDPLLALAYAAALTRRIRLATGIVILPQRHPVYVAKEFATLDVLSGGRAIAGFGIGWLEEEFRVVGVPFDERAARTEESVRAIRSLWSEKPEPFEGAFHRWGPVASSPRPVQQPGVPIVIGGHVEGAARRAARLGDGFFPARGGPEKLQQLFGSMRDECEQLGRNPDEIEISTTGTKDLDAAHRLQDIGVSRIVVPPPGFDAEGLKRGLAEFADTVIAKL